MLKKIEIAINKEESSGIMPTKRSPEEIAASYRSAAAVKQTPEIKKRVPTQIEDNVENMNVKDFIKANRKWGKFLTNWPPKS